MSISIAHISDLHFGMERQGAVWEQLRQFLAFRLRPALILITGDIADSPTEANFEGVRKGFNDLAAAGFRCYVCAGNHDRHDQGVSLDGTSPVLATSAKAGIGLWQRYFGPKAADSRKGEKVNPSLFDTTFSQLGMLMQPGKAEDIKLTSTPGGMSAKETNWRIRLLCMDSSFEAEYLAQGFVTPDMLATLRQSSAWTGNDYEAPDLVIALVHHHLLPVSAIESADRQKFGGLFASTILLNAGTVLETLVDVGANLVLHGHEHCRHLARYGSLAVGKSDITVIGAASATGAHTKNGCSIEHSSFNVLELGDDLSVTLHEYRYTRGEWSPSPGPRHLLGAVEIRRARHLRKQQKNPESSSRVVKQFVFHATRDAMIRQVTTNCLIENNRFRVTTENWTGTPYFWGGTVELPNGLPVPLPKGQDRMISDGNRSFVHEYLLPGQNDSRVVARRVEHEIFWMTGGVLTQDDLRRCPKDLCGPLRGDGKEFVETDVTESLESLTMSIELPPGLSPVDRREFEVLVRPPGERPVRRPELNDRLRFSGLNRIGVNIPYPQAGYGYLIAWRLPEISPVDPLLDPVREGLTAIAERVATAIIANLTKLTRMDAFTVGVYVPEVANGALMFRAVARAGSVAPPPNVTPTANQNPFCSAYWGVPRSVVPELPAQLTAEDAAAGVQVGEFGIFVLPLPSFLSSPVGSPGITRVAWTSRLAENEISAMLVRIAAAVQACSVEMFELVR